MNEDIDDDQLYRAVVIQNDDVEESELPKYVNPEDEWTVDTSYGWGCDDPHIDKEQLSIHEQLSIDMVDSLLDEEDAAINNDQHETPLTRSQKKRRSRRLRRDLRREDLRRDLLRNLRLAPAACVCFPFSLTVSLMQVNQEHHVQVMQRLYRCVFGALQREFPEAIVGLSPSVAPMHF